MPRFDRSAFSGSLALIGVGLGRLTGVAGGIFGVIGVGLTTGSCRSSISGTVSSVSHFANRMRFLSPY